MQPIAETEIPVGAIEDDAANLIERMIEVGIEREGPTERQKQQFRDALAKFVDERIAAAFKARVRRVERAPFQWPDEE